MKYIVASLFLIASHMVSAQSGKMMVRLSEIEIDSNYLQQYKDILQKESRASVEREPGVIAIFPMFQKEHPNQVRIVEIYASREAYEAHIKSPHFQEYKSSTLNMVRSLKLVDMESIDPPTMEKIFSKIKG